MGHISNPPTAEELENATTGEMLDWLAEGCRESILHQQATGEPGGFILGRQVLQPSNEAGDLVGPPVACVIYASGPNALAMLSAFDLWSRQAQEHGEGVENVFEDRRVRPRGFSAPALTEDDLAGADADADAILRAIFGEDAAELPSEEELPRGLLKRFLGRGGEGV